MGRWECGLGISILSMHYDVSTAGKEQGDLLKHKIDASGGRELICAHHILLCLLLFTYCLHYLWS
jgi:hypothetical protein